MKQRELPLLKVILAFLIATVIFLSAFLIGYGVAYYKYQSVLKDQQNVIYKLESLDVEKAFLTSCNREALYSISSELDSMAQAMGILETRLGKNDKQVLEQKKIYTILQIKHFLAMKEYKEKCNSNITLILFFYSNQKEDMGNSERTGFILQNLKAQNINDILVYSIDYHLDLSLVSTLKSVYNITIPDTVLVNEKEKLEKIQNINDIEAVI
jgi:hypothetical protein